MISIYKITIDGQVHSTGLKLDEAVKTATDAGYDEATVRLCLTSKACCFTIKDEVGSALIELDVDNPFAGTTRATRRSRNRHRGW